MQLLLAEEHINPWELKLTIGYPTASLYVKKELGDTTGVEVGLFAGLANYDALEEKNYAFQMLKGFDGYALGLEVESIVTDEREYATVGILEIELPHGFTFAMLPGFEWTKEEDKWEKTFVNNLEIFYEIELIEQYHIEPILKYSKLGDTEHITFGVYIGTSF